MFSYNTTSSLSLPKTKLHNHHHQHHTTPKPLKSPNNNMDPQIWSQTPPEILEHILSFLPLKTLLNFRSTCKHFMSLIFSSSFISKWSNSTSPFSSFLLLSHPQCYHNFPLYDSLLGTWRSFALSLSVSQSSTLLSSSKGLFCFSLRNSSCLLVCNFLSKSNRFIEFPSYDVGFESLTLVSTSFGYRIFMICSKFSSNYAFIYDSTNHSWKTCDGHDSVVLSNNSHQEGVFFRGSLYFTTAEPFFVVYFDMDTSQWKQLTPEVPRELTFIRLVSDGEKRLFLIGGVGQNGISKTIKLWELVDESNWIEIERLPEMMCRKFVSVCYHNYEHVYCFWHEGMVCVCCYTWPEILYYKVERKTWHWLPKCPSVPEKWSCGFRWFPFVPQLCSLA